eukprot:scaffold44599_cov19-Tisochrysis_lutea.AAC.1
MACAGGGDGRPPFAAPPPPHLCLHGRKGALVRGEVIHEARLSVLDRVKHDESIEEVNERREKHGR